MKMLIHAQTIPGKVRPIRLSEPEIFCDREREGRSGHVGHGLCETAPGRILDFSPNTSDKRGGGHAMYGWMEYRISTDWGRTFGEGRVFPFSWKSFLDGIFTVAVEKLTAGADGSVTAYCLRGSAEKPMCCEPYLTPYYVRSEDGGETWGEPKEFSPYPGRIYDAVTADGAAYVLQACGNVGEFPAGDYRLFRSGDNGKTFEEISVLPIGNGGGNAYGNLIVNPDGSLTAYLYNLSDEQHMDCAVSRDGGRTWDEVFRSYVANRIRNPQVMILDGQYILHGRAGENGPGAGSFVFYTSADGREWDEGTLLSYGRPACYYSNNLVLRCPDGKERALVEYSENYQDPELGVWSGTCNEMHLWVESAD